MIEIVPAIDIIDGRCVRLSKGDYALKRVYDMSPVEMARKYQDCGVRRIHLVDLDGAKISSPANLDTLEKIRSKVSVELEWGGGVSSTQAPESVISAGADQVVIGSVAVREGALFKQWLSKYGPSRLILGADVRNGRVAVKGWQEDSAMTLEEIISMFLEDSLRDVICTDISKDGMLEGPSSSLYVELSRKFPSIRFTVSGGISSMDDIRALDALGLERVIVGKAIYESRISLKEIGEWSQNA